MCDTMVALGNSTIDGSVIFAKNSDRDPNEAQNLVFVPAMDHNKNDRLKCTYISIPQVEHTNAVLLSKPFWIWGAEIGANEHGVVIGNEAVFSKVPSNKKPSLIGMDYLRLALERASNSYDAMFIIINLLEKYGQGGNCGYYTPFYYHNSFLIADQKEAWVLETVDKRWIAEKVKDVRSISNAYTIGNEWDLASPDLIDFAISKGFYDNKGEFNFKDCYSDRFFTYFSFSKNCHVCTSDSLRKNRKNIDVKTMMQTLKSHASEEGSTWSPDKSILWADVCMHAGFSLARANQSVGSMVSKLNSEGNIHWMTGTSAPCLSIYKPLWLDSSVPDSFIPSEGFYQEGTTFWKHEVFHRQVLKDYAHRVGLIKEEQDNLQQKFIDLAKQYVSLSENERYNLSEKCFNQVDELLNEWTYKVRNEKKIKSNPFYYSYAWNRINHRAQIYN